MRTIMLGNPAVKGNPGKTAFLGIRHSPEMPLGYRVQESKRFRNTAGRRA